MAEWTDKGVCSICLNDFQQPVITDCHHSFCFCCLEDYVNKTSTNDQFICPLCRGLIQIPSGGLNQLKPTPDIEDHSTIHIPQCDVCTDDTPQYYCGDCDQYLCKSCRSTHDKLKICKGHVLCRFDENKIGQRQHSRSIEKYKKNTPDTCVTRLTDFCPNHKREKVTIYCKDCTLAVCWDCFAVCHNGHYFLDLQKDAVRQNIRQDLKTLNDELETQIKRFQKHYDILNSKLTEVKDVTKTECDKVDAHVDKICSEFRKIGENIKREMQENGEQEESELGKLMEEIKRLTEDLKASVKYSVNVLENSSIVQVLQRLPKVRQEKDKSCCRKLDIPDVEFSIFQEADDIDETFVTYLFGQVVSCHPNMIEDIFNVDTVEVIGKHFKQHSLKRCGYSDKHYLVSGIKFSIEVLYFATPSLEVELHVIGLEDRSIKSCKVDLTFKVINKTDDRQSVVKQCVETVGSHDRITCCDIIDLNRLSNPGNGFIDDHRNFKIQVTINEVTDIERGDESDYMYSSSD